ncbi:MAG TPA: hypothetical protein VHQ70_07510 [Syntrophomonadaceae bacterium]|nr:hypothetical protein [Syntrophomonadaceae bacterium]
MFNFKNISARVGLSIIFILIMVAVLFLARSSLLSRRTLYSLSHYLSGQETKYVTADLDELDTTHYIIKYQPLDSQYAPMVGKTAEEAYTEVTRVFGQEPQGKTTIIIYPDTTSLAKSFGWDKNEKALGVYWAGTIRILSPGEWLGDDNMEASFRKQGPMVHEFAHLLVDDITKGNYNRWWTEGIAQYVEKKTTGFEFSSPFTSTEDINYYHFSVLDRNFDELDQSVAYWQSLKAVEFISQKYGEQSLFEILDELGQQYTLNQAFEKTLGINMNTFEQEFAEFVRQNN